MTVFMIGDGPSKRRLTPDLFAPEDRIITLNHAILAVRPLDLPNLTYVSQKDGCVPHRMSTVFTPCDGVCVTTDRIVEPQEPEIAVFSKHESPNCFPDYRDRVVVDVEKEFGVPWFTPSAPVMVLFAQKYLGAQKITMLCMDGYHSGTPKIYRSIGIRAQRVADKAGVELVWVLP